MRDTESSSSSIYPNSASDYTPPPKKQNVCRDQANLKEGDQLFGSLQADKGCHSRTDSIITNKVERAEPDADSEAPMVPEGGAPTFAPIFNANPRKVGKKKTVEKFYQKRMQLEYILLRPDIYIGSTKVNSQRQLIYDDTTDSLIKKGYPISEILLEIHKEEKVYIPKLIFGHLLTSSNYDDSEKKVVGKHNGYRAKLCNIFSTEFIVETASKESGKKYYQKFTNNMSMIGPPKITKLGKGKEFTRITFQPDLSKF
ncbi:hypothetical protein L0F63_003475 [Massospora cicadina]|nr:hypothetical protein L0F63_003475 [Massospora cicadina]